MCASKFTRKQSGRWFFKGMLYSDLNLGWENPLKSNSPISFMKLGARRCLKWDTAVRRTCSKAYCTSHGSRSKIQLLTPSHHASQTGRLAQSSTANGSSILELLRTKPLKSPPSLLSCSTLHIWPVSKSCWVQVLPLLTMSPATTLIQASHLCILEYLNSSQWSLPLLLPRFQALPHTV